MVKTMGFRLKFPQQTNPMRNAELPRPEFLMKVLATHMVTGRLLAPGSTLEGNAWLLGQSLADDGGPGRSNIGKYWKMLGTSWGYLMGLIWIDMD